MPSNVISQRFCPEFIIPINSMRLGLTSLQLSILHFVLPALCFWTIILMVSSTFEWLNVFLKNFFLDLPFAYLLPMSYHICFESLYLFSELFYQVSYCSSPLGLLLEKCHKLGGLQTINICFWKFWRLGVRDLGGTVQWGWEPTFRFTDGAFPCVLTWWKEMGTSLGPLLLKD